jgi:dUTP pyrophosphatase
MLSLDDAVKQPLVKIKKVNPNAQLPKYAKPGDACFDLFAVSHPKYVYVESSGSLDYLEYDTGIALEIPKGWKGLCYPRSSISKTCLTLANCVGVIDSGYRDTIKARFRPVGQFDPNRVYGYGDRIIQMEIVPVPEVTFQVVDELSDSERGKGGFGSTGS